MPVDHAKLEAFMGKMINEMGAAMNGFLILLGDRLGLYRAMAGAGPMTSAQLAAKTGTAERYVREWLNAQAAGGFVEYLPPNNGDAPTYRLPSPKTCQNWKPRLSPAKAWAGTSTTCASSAAPSAFSAPATTPTSSPPGFPRSRASRKNSSAVPPLPTWAAGTAHPPS